MKEKFSRNILEETEVKEYSLVEYILHKEREEGGMKCSFDSGPTYNISLLSSGTLVGWGQ